MASSALTTLLQNRWHGAAIHGQATALSGWSTGIVAVDRVLAPIGIPRGRLTELWGTFSCGKTTLAYALLRARIAAGDLAAYVDAEGSLFAPSARSAGIDLKQLVVVRPRSSTALLRAVDALVRGGACSVVVVDTRAEQVLQTHHCARLVSQAEKTGTALVVLSRGRNPAIASFATLRLCGAALKPLWQPGDDGGKQLLGYTVEMEISKARTVAPGKRMSFTVQLPAVVNSWPCAPEPVAVLSSAHAIAHDAAEAHVVPFASAANQ